MQSVHQIAHKNRPPQLATLGHRQPAVNGACLSRRQTFATYLLEACVSTLICHPLVAHAQVLRAREKPYYIRRGRAICLFLVLPASLAIEHFVAIETLWDIGHICRHHRRGT